jgi:hypothetical protein
MTMKPVTVFVALFLCGSIYAQQKIDNEYVALQILQGHAYTLAVLKPTGYLPNDSLRTWSMMHLINLFQMHADKRTSIFGPVTDPKADVGGIIIFNSVDTVQIKSWIAEDPLIKNKVFSYQLYPWFSIPDQKLLPTAPPKQ